MPDQPKETPPRGFGDAAATRGGGGGRTPRAPRRPTKAAIKSEVEGLLGFSSIILSFTPWSEDALTPPETIQLADALADEIDANPAVLKWLQRAGSIAPHVKLINVTIAIAYVRLVNHGIVPAITAEGGRPPDVAVPVGTGGAHGGGGGHRDGQEYPDGPPPVVSPVHGSGENEARPDSVSGEADNPNPAVQRRTG